MISFHHQYCNLKCNLYGYFWGLSIIFNFKTFLILFEKKGEFKRKKNLWSMCHRIYLCQLSVFFLIFIVYLANYHMKKNIWKLFMIIIHDHIINFFSVEFFCTITYLRLHSLIPTTEQHGLVFTLLILIFNSFLLDLIVNFLSSTWEKR